MAGPLRVVARVHGYPPDHNAGAEWALHGMLRALAARGHDVQVHLHRYGAGLPGRYDVDDVQVHPLQSSYFPDAGRAADVLIGHLEGVPALAEYGRTWQVPTVAVVHNTHQPSFEAAAGCDLAVYNAQWTAAEAAEFYTERGLAAPAGLVVRPPVSAADYATAPGDRVTLVNLCEAKGGRLFWELAERMPDVGFLAVQGAYGEQVVPAVVPDNVALLPQTPGALMRERVYARSRIILMPSSYESWGRVGVEAMASGIPVVAHPAPGLAESLGAAGVFADRGDVGAWESEIRRLLAPKAWSAASKRALKRSAELDPAADLAAWCDAVEDLASRRGVTG
ncbi:glycosyltransferase family 4 protein [Kitasatospora sp. NPDC092948]|uniref:glycosyltransferase family 4 protein n=1 Tax=Kitasatospora sp. NPDC092948 TaxID=3364088 RepID=UPI00381A0094